MCFQVCRQKLWRREVQAKLPAGDGRLQPRAVQVAQPAAAFERDAGQEVGGGEGNGRGHQGVGEARSRGRQGALSSARRVGPGRRNEGGRLISNLTSCSLRIIFRYVTHKSFSQMWIKYIHPVRYHQTS